MGLGRAVGGSAVTARFLAPLGECDAKISKWNSSSDGWENGSRGGNPAGNLEGGLWMEQHPRHRNAIGKPPNSPLKSGASLLCWETGIRGFVSAFGLSLGPRWLSFSLFPKDLLSWASLPSVLQCFCIPNLPSRPNGTVLFLTAIFPIPSFPFPSLPLFPIFHYYSTLCYSSNPV
ncbi:uncharacterized protein ACIB01_019538 isoform 1-T1 [Guaruba guarouba]